MLTHGELFAGISGFGLGFARAGIETCWAVEIDAACRRVLAHHHPGAVIHEDVRDVGAHNLTPVDIITFGSPCQGMSVAGKRGGFADERSGLYFEAIRIIRELNPQFAVWENVPGAFSSAGGRDFAAALSALVGCDVVVPARGWGTCGVVFGPTGQAAWRVLNAQWFGVAQRRRRVFVVYDPRTERAGEILIESQSLRGNSPPRRAAGTGVARALTGGFGSGGADDNAGQAEHLIAYQCHGTNVGEMGTLRQGNGDVTGGVPFITHALTSDGFDASEDGTGRGTPLVAVGIDGSDDIGYALRATASHSGDKGDGGINTTLVAIQDAAMPRAKQQHGIGIASDGPMYRLDGNGAHAVAFDWYASPSQTLNVGESSPPLKTTMQPAVAFTENQQAELRTSTVAGPVTNDGGKPGQGYPAVLSSMSVRRLTPTECERLQGFPDGWTDIVYVGYPDRPETMTFREWDELIEKPPKKITRHPSDRTRYRQLGNAVCVNVSEWLANQIVNVTRKGTDTWTA